MSDLLSHIAELDAYRALCARLGVPVVLDEQSLADLAEIEAMAKEYIHRYATSNEVAHNCTDERRETWD